ncbi:MAG: ATP-binding protein, partial [Chloroflexota bacterium]
KHADAPNGVGLGLAFCRLAVEAHGGKIWVENLAEGGASFIFTLPLEPVAATAAAHV